MNHDLPTVGAPPPAAPGESFAWIEDDGLLRDEGVVFGLSSSGEGLGSKEACIRAYFDLRRLECARARGALVRELDELSTERQRLQPPVAFEGRTAGADEVVQRRWRLAAAAACCALLAVLCVAAGYLVYDLIQPDFTYAGWVAAALVASGLLCFVPRAMRSPEPSAEGWRMWMQAGVEGLLPVAAAGFVAVWAWPHLSPGRAVAAAVLLALVFTLSGKLVLRAGPAQASERARARSAADAELRQVGGREAELRRQVAALRSDEEWKALCEARIALFRSEFELANAARPAPAPPVMRPVLQASSL